VTRLCSLLEVESPGDDSATLIAFAKTFEMFGSWSSCRKTHVGIVARLEPSMANSFVTSFFLVIYASI
jgi:hypothetical protein